MEARSKKVLIWILITVGIIVVAVGTCLVLLNGQGTG